MVDVLRRGRPAARPAGSVGCTHLPEHADGRPDHVAAQGDVAALVQDAGTGGRRRLPPRGGRAHRRQPGAAARGPGGAPAAAEDAGSVLVGAAPPPRRPAGRLRPLTLRAGLPVQRAHGPIRHPQAPVDPAVDDRRHQGRRRRRPGRGPAEPAGHQARPGLRTRLVRQRTRGGELARPVAVVGLLPAVAAEGPPAAGRGAVRGAQRHGRPHLHRTPTGRPRRPGWHEGRGGHRGRPRDREGGPLRRGRGRLPGERRQARTPRRVRVAPGRHGPDPLLR